MSHDELNSTLSQSLQNPTSTTKKLGLFLTTSIIIGTMIGSGIFKKAGPMAGILGSSELLMIVWIIAGIVTLFGALTNAEVASMIPGTGGQYNYFRIMYGDVFAFLYGWSIFIVIQCGSIASIAYIFSEYVHSVVPLFTVSESLQAMWKVQLPLFGTINVLADMGVKALTMSVILLLTIINYRGVVFGGIASGIFTSLKVAAIIAIIIISFAHTPEHTLGTTIAAQPLVIPTGMMLILAIITAMGKAFWAYDGWNSITYIAGEVNDAQRTIPRALIIGVSSVIGLYVLINAAFIYVLPIQQMATSSLVAADVMVKTLGVVGSSFVAIAVMISTFGATNSTILNSARVYFAMARDGLFFKQLQTLHPQYNTPSVSLVVQAIWSCILVLTGTFETLTDMLIFVSWIYYAMSAYGIFILRKKMPDTHRPYRVWGYPFTPVIFILVSCVFLCLVLYNDIHLYLLDSSKGIPSLVGVVICFAGLPLYLLFTKSSRE